MTYETKEGVKPSGPSHTDIVVNTETKNGTEFLETVGGNTYDYETKSYDTVGRKRWKLKDGAWVMVDGNDAELGDPPWNASEDDVFGFIRLVENSSAFRSRPSGPRFPLLGGSSEVDRATRTGR